MPARPRLVALAALGMTLLAGGLTLGLAPARSAQPTENPIVDGRLTSGEALKTVLESLGYAPQDGDGGNWLFTRKQGEWEISLFALLNSDSSIIWIKCYLGRLEDPESFQTRHYVALLQEQGRISPRFFFTVPVEESTAADLYICRGLDNRALTAKLIGDEIALVQTWMGESVKSWNYTGWTRAGEPGAEPPAPASPETPPG